MVVNLCAGGHVDTKKGVFTNLEDTNTRFKGLSLYNLFATKKDY